jgi:membrane-associated protease RseP (regulator of RpoE activity)
MGTPRFDFPDPPDVSAPDAGRTTPLEPAYVPRLGSPPHVPERRWRHLILFLLTILATTFAGQLHYASFVLGFSNAALPFSSWELLVRGLWYSVPILAILGAHEFGHYFACRYYRVDASLPYFLPVPFLMTGTLGAFIRIRQQIPTKRALFDIGIAGPIAGFVVAVPVLLVGMYLSRVIAIPQHFEGTVVELGEPLLFKAAALLVFGPIPDGFTVNMHPMAFAAWFGLLATALNLFPIGQLDGGHISYAVLGRKSTAVTLVAVASLIGLSFVSQSLLVWTVLMIVMLVVFGPRHPRIFDEEVPLDHGRVMLALFAAVMFVVCFTPAPMELSQLLER